MTPSIDVDEEIYDLLERNAKPFVDTPNSVLRRLLSLDESDDATPALTSAEPTSPARPRVVRATAAKPAKSRGKRQKRTRAPSHALLPEVEYELPILQVLADAGGRLPTREVVAAVGERVADKLRELDHEPTTSGRPRWESRVQFARLALTERGDLVKDSPRGVWEISETGKARLGAPVAA
jgi:hypothetical protein